ARWALPSEPPYSPYDSLTPSNRSMQIPLGPIDLAVLLAFVIAAVAVGVRLGARTHSVEAYLLGDRNLPWWAILGSIVATETSTVTVLSVPGEAYGATGMRFLQLTFGFILGRAM